MSHHRFCKYAIAMIILFLASLTCGACRPEPTPTPTIVPTETPTPTATPIVPTEAPTPTIPPITPLEIPTPCPQVDCLPDCYANNSAPPGGNGTIDSQWLATESDTGPFDLVKCAAKATGSTSSSLTMMTCDDAQSPTCRAKQYVYNGLQWSVHSTDEQAANPYVGVPLPFSYILVSLALVGTLLVGTGVVLRQRARQLRS
jgi:hypothetical protein